MKEIKEESSAVVTTEKGVIVLPTHEQAQVSIQKGADERAAFRKLILEQLDKGKHYGFPHGCEVNLDDNGDIIQFSRGKRIIVPKEQWQAKPSLYRDGAMKIKDIFASIGFSLRPEFERSMPQAGLYISVCHLVGVDDGKIYGEGQGVFKAGTKSMDDNGASQMADKRAFVAACRWTYPCVSELFTQDMEDGKIPTGAPDRNEPLVTDQSANIGEGFSSLLQDWVDESIEPYSPLDGHTITNDEIKNVRCQITMWCGENPPETPDDAVAYLKENAEVLPHEDADGHIVGVRFAQKDC